MRFPLTPLQLIRRLKSVHDPVDDAQVAKALQEWFASPIGQYQIQSESRLIKENLSNLFGYHLMQLSACNGLDLTESSRISHCFSLRPGLSYADQFDRNDPLLGTFAEFDALPIENEQIDVTILHHVLEFSNNPHQVLKEAARVTIPRGYILIVGFNPLSLDGLFHRIGRLFSERAIWKRRSLHTRRMKDWLEFLDFTCVDTRYVSYNFSINNHKYLSNSHFIDRLIGGNKFPLGSSYCLLARKDKVGLTPIKPTWDKTLIRAIPIPKQAMKVPIGKSANILPFRSKFKKEL